MKAYLKDALAKLKKISLGALKSWTVWFNTALLATPELLNALPALKENLDADMYKTLAAVGIIGNLILRIKTTKALGDK